jgi:hypothetical protein
VFSSHISAKCAKHSRFWSRAILARMSNATTRFAVMAKQCHASDHSKLVFDRVTGEHFFWFSGIETNFAVHLFSFVQIINFKNDFNFFVELNYKKYKLNILLG